MIYQTFTKAWKNRIYPATQNYCAMHWLTIATGLIMLWLISPSCKKVDGHGPIQTESRNEKNFTAIDYRLSGKAIITTGADYSITIEAQRNVLEAIETSVNNGKLNIKPESGKRIGEEDITVHITMPSVAGLYTGGIGSMEVHNDGFTTNGTLNLGVSGAGSISIDNATANRVEAEISGSGDIKLLGGKSNSQKFSISGAGNMEAANHISKTSEIKISGSGEAKVNVLDYLKANLSGSGTIYYRGTPQIESHTSGAGKVVKL
ncbi:DUF2807 domain-containing protein [Mucilaginibacter sp. Bleaf8]|uniref:head GIN domain-containing protein n=1 Tax=Mucilaginibacter sp. Bleaf8 TaxID=2834430 RepID=UPI001BCF82E6|nr:head GIN domain-containing protein [Mucilaginibacter sp. Bleaf8]MBS7563513.1 DUF2807 domain-containing protein [Mucilaginibacter sp. Bleaf8]